MKLAFTIAGIIVVLAISLIGAFIVSLNDEITKNNKLEAERAMFSAVAEVKVKELTEKFDKEIAELKLESKKSIAELRNFGISRIASAVKGPDSIINGIDKISRCEIHVDERCRYTVEEFENYTWTKDKFGEYVNKPIDAFNHHIDSIRYGIQAVINKKSSDLNYVPLIG